MKDHRKAEVVNEITELAKRYSGTQQLRDQMSRAINSYLKEQDRDTRHACAEAVIQYEKEVSVECILKYDAHSACMNVKAV